jgi:hypothetical protein
VPEVAFTDHGDGGPRGLPGLDAASRGARSVPAGAPETPAESEVPPELLLPDGEGLVVEPAVGVPVTPLRLSVAAAVTPFDGSGLEPSV